MIGREQEATWRKEMDFLWDLGPVELFARLSVNCFNSVPPSAKNERQTLPQSFHSIDIA